MSAALPSSVNDVLSLAERSRMAARALGLTFEQYLHAKGFDDDDCEAMLWDWEGFWARPCFRKPSPRYANEYGGQLPPDTSWLVWLLLTGRGFGKTRSAAEYIRARARDEPGIRIALVGQDPGDVWRVMLRGKSGLLSICPPGERPHYSVTTRTLSWPNGSTASVFSGHNIEEFRGPEFSLVWIDELMAFPKPDEAWDLAFASNRIVSPHGLPPRIVVTTTPRPRKKLKQIMNLSGTVITTGTTFDNAANLAPTFLVALREMFEGTRYGDQELLGMLLEDNDGALWNEALIALRRLGDYPDLTRIVVSMDPSASDGKSTTSAEAGIVIAGVDAEEHAFILEDASGTYSPDRWAREAVRAYRRWDADEVIAEANNGGAMIASLIANVDPTVPVRLIHAHSSKMDRARPASQLTERGRVFFVGHFTELETQLVSFTGKGKSPDRLDAMVWAIHDLLAERIAAVAASFA